MNPLYCLKDRVIFRVTGPDFVPMLNKICTANLQDISYQNPKYGCLLSPQSKFRCDFFLYGTTNKEEVLCDLNHTFIDTFWSMVLQYKMRSQFTHQETNYVVTCELDLYDATNPKQHETDHTKKNSTVTHNNDALCHNYPDPRSTFLPRRIIQPADARTYANGTSLYRDILIKHQIVDGSWLQQDKSFILEYAFDKIGAIDFSKGCYLGQELITRTKHTGSIRKKVCSFKLISQHDVVVHIAQADYYNMRLNGDHVADGVEIIYEDKKVGHVVAIDSKLAEGIALIRIPDIANYN